MDEKKIVKLDAGQGKVPALEPVFSVGFLLLLLIVLVMVVLTFPLQIIVGVLVKLNSAGPVFYAGPRVGLGTRIFQLRKFRTLPDKYEYNVGSRLLTSKERNQSLLAKIIVRVKLDELPQLYNVLKGEMSLVGRRPVRPALYARYMKEIPGYSTRFRVRPGITGLAQIVGGYYMDPVDKHYYDMLYVYNKSVLLDLKILALTLIALIFSRRIMKYGIIIKFLGLPIEMKSRHIEPPESTYEEVTSSPGEKQDAEAGEQKNKQAQYELG